MPAQNTTQRNSSAEGLVPKRKDAYLNKGANEDPDAVNREGIPEEAIGTSSDEKREEAEETRNASEEEEREKELEQERK